MNQTARKPEDMPGRHPRFHTRPPPPGNGDGAARDLRQSHARLKALLEISAMVRGAASLEDLHYIIANETLRLTGARQIFVFTAKRAMHLSAISGFSRFNREAPLVRDMEQVTELFRQRGGFAAGQAFELPPETVSRYRTLMTYPFRHLMWQPFAPPGAGAPGQVSGGMLLVRERPWSGQDVQDAGVLASIYGHAHGLFRTRPRRGPRFDVMALLKRRRGKAAIAAGLLLVLAFPVRMTVLAPFEVIPIAPFVVAAPIEGVIKDVLVDPGQSLRAGQKIVQFNDTVPRNRLQVAEREVSVSKARLKKASQLAFSDVSGRQELRLAMADLALKTSELNYARDVFNRTLIKSGKAGIALFPDKQSLIGKPVAVGEQIMQIADPRRIKIAIHVPVSDSIALQPGAAARIYLDSDPVNSRDARVEFINYQASPTPEGILAYRITARLAGSKARLPRLGVRGTAKIYGGRVLLAAYLFRRPFSALRQWIGL